MLPSFGGSGMRLNVYIKKNMFAAELDSVPGLLCMNELLKILKSKSRRNLKKKKKSKCKIGIYFFKLGHKMVHIMCISYKHQEEWEDLAN